LGTSLVRGIKAFGLTIIEQFLHRDYSATLVNTSLLRGRKTLFRSVVKCEERLKRYLCNVTTVSSQNRFCLCVLGVFLVIFSNHPNLALWDFLFE
jgi:hypothetical protein